MGAAFLALIFVCESSAQVDRRHDKVARLSPEAAQECWREFSSAKIAADYCMAFKLTHIPRKAKETVYKGGIDLVITDLKMPEKTGEEFLKDILEFDKHIPVIVLTGHGNVETAVEMMRLGAYDFMTKPFNLDKMLLIIARALESKNIKKTNETLEKRVDYNESFYGMIGHSAKILKVYEAIYFYY